MKKLNYKSILPAATLLLLAACTKNIVDETPRQSDRGQYASVQLYNAAIGTNRNILYVDGVPVNSIPFVYTSTAFTGSSVTYAVSPGTRAFLIRDTLTATTQVPLTFNNSLQPNTHYTIFTYDTLTSVQQLTVAAPYQTPPRDTTVRVRFAHLAYQKAGAPGNVDIFSKLRNEKIFSNIAFKAVTDYVPFASRRSDTLIVRPAGVSNVDLAQSVVSFSDQRFYTLVFRGRFNETAAASYPRVLATFLNY
ncbi:MAG: DUF4397 domain-containing protein [Chitinophagaceae bacterium]